MDYTEGILTIRILFFPQVAEYSLIVGLLSEKHKAFEVCRLIRT
jgi:hypothetical protein